LESSRVNASSFKDNLRVGNLLEVIQQLIEAYHIVGDGIVINFLAIDHNAYVRLPAANINTENSFQ
jgi:hypothetical protein